MVDKGAGKDCEYGLKAHDERSCCGVGVLLGHDLEGIAYCRGHDAGVKNRQPAIQNLRKLELLEEKHEDDTDCAGNQELDAGHFYAVAFW